MLKRLTPREQIINLTAEWEPQIRAQFLAAVRDVLSKIVLQVIIVRLEKNDIQGAIDALGIERAAFGGLASSIVQAFNAGGVAIVGNMPALRDPEGNRAILRFDVRDPVAEEWAREHSSTLIQGITDDAREAARLAIEGGLGQGKGPQAIAVDLAGRKNRVTGAREGGAIGLTSPQADQRAELRRILADPDRISEYFVKDRETGELKPRYGSTPRRFDRQVAKAISAGKALDADSIDKISTLHTNKLLETRAKVIARTETMEAMETAHHEGFRQTIERLGLNPVTDLEKEWRATSGDRTRDTHMALHGKIVTGLDTPFMSFSGAQLRYPGDRSLGAPASELINCRCHPNYRLRFERALR